MSGGGVSQQNAEKVAQIAAQRLLRDTEDPPPDWVRDGAIRQVLKGDAECTPKECVGNCGALVIRPGFWRKLSAEKRARLNSLNVRRDSSLGRCWTCVEAGKPGKGPGRGAHNGPHLKVTPEVKARIPEIWRQVKAEGGGQKELGRRLGVSRERARQLVKELGLSSVSVATERARAFLEELEFLVSCGLGVYEISRSLGMTDTELLGRLEYLRARGRTTLLFENYRFGEPAKARSTSVDDRFGEAA